MNFLKKLFGRNSLTEQNPFDLDPKTRFVAIDVETANADTSTICQIGLAWHDQDGVVQSCGYLVNPSCTFDKFNTRLHGIDAQLVRPHPHFPVVLNIFAQRIEAAGIPVVQHSNFDKLALEGACDRYRLPSPRFKWIDSVKIAQRAWPELKGQGGHGLANLKVHLDLDFRHHDAENDARAAAMVVLRAEAHSGLTLDQLTRPNRKHHSAKPYISCEGKADGPLAGQVVVFTGELTMDRAQAASTAAEHGLTVRNSVTKKTSLLVVGDQDLTVLAGHSKSSKHRKAEELIADGQHIQIIGEADFLRLTGRN